MSPEDGAPKPITPRRTAFAILFTMRPTSTRSLLPSSSRGLNPRSPFSLPLHFVCLFPQLPHIQKQSHQIPIHPIPRLHCTPSTAYARMGCWKGPFRLLSNLPFQRAILSRRTMPTHLPPWSWQGINPQRFHNLPDRATCHTSTWDRTVQLSRFAHFRLIPPHDYPHHTNPANHTLTHRLFHRPAIAPTAASVLFPPSSHGAKSIIRKMDYFPLAYLRHTTGIAHPKPILHIIPSLMLKPYAQIIRYCK